jgi:hypothetical protein
MLEAWATTGHRIRRCRSHVLLSVKCLFTSFALAISVAAIAQPHPEMDAVVDSYVERMKTNEVGLRELEDIWLNVRRGHGEERLFWHYHQASGKVKYRILLAGRSHIPILEAASLGGHAELRAAVASLLGNGSEPEPFKTARRRILMRLLDDPAPMVKERALWQLRFIRRPATFDPRPKMVSLLKDRDRWVRVAAAVALDYRHDSRGVPLLVHEFVDEDINHSQEWRPLLNEATGVLLKFSYRAMPLLLERLKSREARIRGRAMRVLGWSRPKKLMELALPYTKDMDPWVRAEAYAAVGADRRAESIPILLVGLKDPDARVRGRVESTFRSPGWPYPAEDWKEGMEALKKAGRG